MEMKTLSNSGRIKWVGPLVIVAVVAAVALAASFSAGQQALNGCLAAIILSCLAGCTALIPVVYAAVYKPGLLAGLVPAVSVIRLLVMLAGTVIIIVFVDISILWFVLWTGVFYLLVLVLETRTAIRAAGTNKVVGAAKA